MTSQEQRQKNRQARTSPGAENDRTITILVVDDAAVDRRIAGALVERELDARAVYADNGRTALEAMERDRPDLVLTDLRMPEVDGLALVAAVREQHPQVPVVLMTAYGSEELAVQALGAGAASYVSKKSLDKDLVEILQQVLAVAHTGHEEERLLECLDLAELKFTFSNDRSLFSAFTLHVQKYLSHLGLCGRTGNTRMAVALEEALLNAMYHGNLEVSSELRHQGDEPYYQLAKERCQQPPYRNRQVHCAAKLSRAEAVYTIRDEGPGFDRTILPDPTDPANVERHSGRGLLLIHTFMDEVSFNPTGNEITMIKRRE